MSISHTSCQLSHIQFGEYKYSPIDGCRGRWLNCPSADTAGLGSVTAVKIAKSDYRALLSHGSHAYGAGNTKSLLYATHISSLSMLTSDISHHPDRRCRSCQEANIKFQHTKQHCTCYIHLLQVMCSGILTLLPARQCRCKTSSQKGPSRSQCNFTSLMSVILCRLHAVVFRPHHQLPPADAGGAVRQGQLRVALL